MRDFTNKLAARKLLEGVKSEQWGHNPSKGTGMYSKSYFNLSSVTRSTEKALFIHTPTNPECKEGFWIPKSVCKFEFENHHSDKNIIRVSIQMPYSMTADGKEERNYSGITRDNAVANFITRTGGDVYCNA